MARRPLDTRNLAKKIAELPADKVAEVADFVEFLRTRHVRSPSSAFSKLAEPAFRKVWDNPADAEYDKL